MTARAAITLLKAASFAAYELGVCSLVRKLKARDRVTLVYYHDIAVRSPLPETALFTDRQYFREHLAELTRTYSVVGMSDLLSDRPLPPYPLVIGFDGYGSSLLAVAKELSSRNVQAVFYLQTEPIVTGRPHWRQRLYFVFRHLNKGPFAASINGEEVRGSTTDQPRANVKLARGIAQRMERLEDPQAVVDEIAERYGVAVGEFDAAQRPLRPEEVSELAACPGAEVGSHSHRHTVGVELGPGRVQEELVLSKQLLEGWTGETVVHYAYPSGQVDGAALAALPEAGYRTAVTTGKSLHSPGAAEEWPYRIPRFGAPNGPPYLLAGKLIGLEKGLDVLSRVRNRLRGRPA